MDVLGEDVHTKFAEIKLAAAERSPKASARRSRREIQYYHEVTNSVPSEHVLDPPSMRDASGGTR